MFLQQKMCIWSFKISMQLNIKKNISCGFVCGFYFYFGERGDTAYDGLPHKLSKEIDIVWVWDPDKVSE
jgi:hypothetical protein